MIKILIDFFTKLSNILAYIADFLRDTQFHERYYVYVPTGNKPRFVHHSYKSARQEAERIYKKLNKDETVEILQIVNSFEPEIPF